MGKDIIDLKSIRVLYLDAGMRAFSLPRWDGQGRLRGRMSAHGIRVLASA